MKRGKAKTRPNGHGGANGHAFTAKRAGPAASDDARGTPAGAVAHAHATAADRTAYAEVADACSVEERVKDLAPPEPGSAEDVSLMQDGAAFVHAVAARVNMVKASSLLVASLDPKISKAELDRLREMKFGKVSVAGPGFDDPPQLIIDVPRPERE